jgi:hypothetical protein
MSKKRQKSGRVQSGQPSPPLPRPPTELSPSRPRRGRGAAGWPPCPPSPRAAPLRPYTRSGTSTAPSVGRRADYYTYIYYLQQTTFPFHNVSNFSKLFWFDLLK